jgi:hypothetical protein
MDSSFFVVRLIPGDTGEGIRGARVPSGRKAAWRAAVPPTHIKDEPSLLRAKPPKGGDAELRGYGVGAPDATLAGPPVILSDCGGRFRLRPRDLFHGRYQW